MLNRWWIACVVVLVGWAPGIASGGLLGVDMDAKPGRFSYEPGGGLGAHVIGHARAALAARAAGATAARPLYFMVPFGYQGRGNDAHESHTFASFVRATGPRSFTWLTISWLPATFADDMKITIFGAPVTGRNWSLGETLEFARRGGLTVACWGPYAITERLYEAAERRVVELRSGRLLYTPNDHGKRERGEATNCMHAVVDLDGRVGTYGGLFNLGLGYWGIKGTKHVLAQYRANSAAWMLDPVEPGRFATWSPGRQRAD